jgi:hypothetical protein
MSKLKGDKGIFFSVNMGGFKLDVEYGTFSEVLFENVLEYEMMLIKRVLSNPLPEYHSSCNRCMYELYNGQLPECYIDDEWCDKQKGL